MTDRNGTQPPIDLTATTALVTGAGHGIGRAVAEALAGAGADVVVHYGNTADGAETTVKQIEALGRRAIAVQADVVEPAAVERLIEQTLEFGGGVLDILVHNAGHLVQRSAIAEMSPDLWHRVIDVNLTSTYLVCRAALPPLRRSTRGRVVTMSSLAAHSGGGQGSAAYAAAKAGVLGFTKGLAKEVAADGITVNALAPGFIGGTAFHDTFTPLEAQRAMVSGIPMGRPGTPQDVAGAVLFLVSDLAGFVTGQTVDINGGQLTR